MSRYPQREGAATAGQGPGRAYADRGVSAVGAAPGWRGRNALRGRVRPHPPPAGEPLCAIGFLDPRHRLHRHRGRAA